MRNFIRASQIFGYNSGMCGRYRLSRTDQIVAMLASLTPQFEEFSQLRIEPRFNVAPSQHLPVILANPEGKAEVRLLRWGLIPSWTKERPKLQPINARAESIATSPMFRGAFDRRRCLVPADGFYEWQKLGGKEKQPMFIHRRDDGLFAFAGLWERWRPAEDAEPVETYTIITTTPNALMSPIHDRMPVVLARGDYARWIDPRTKGADVADLLRPAPAEEMEAIKVSKLVNSPKNDVPECIAPLSAKDPAD